MTTHRVWRRKARFELGQKIDRKILAYFQEHGELSTEEVRGLLHKEGLAAIDMYSPCTAERLSFTGVNKRISNMRVGGLLYYTGRKGNRLKMTLHGEAVLAGILLKEEQEYGRKEEGLRVQPVQALGRNHITEDVP